jgi:hypothetical protein
VTDRTSAENGQWGILAIMQEFPSHIGRIRKKPAKLQFFQALRGQLVAIPQK